MTMQSDTAVAKRRKRVAAEYRRQGYRVLVPGSGDALPTFLSDSRPDLVAESPGDRAVILIKPSRALRGSNDLTELAALIEGQPGWRLELISIGNESEDEAVLSRPDWLERMLRRPDLTADHALPGIHAVFLTDVLGVLVRSLAAVNRIRVRDKDARRIAQELAYKGIVDQETLDEIESAFAWRSLLMHGLTLPSSPEAQATKLIALCRQLHAQAMNEAAMAA